MRWALLASVVLLAGWPLSVAGQVQPDVPPDPALFTARTEVAEAGSLEGAQRVLRFVQVSDAHVLDDDAPYPLRQEPLDPFITAFSTAAQRPQEEYTDEVLESIVRAINAQHTGDRFQFVVNTGDNVDNDLENELMRFLDLWDGTSTVTGPVSGLACVPDGQSTSLQDTSHDVTDQCTSLPEALLANRTALAPDLPWYSAFGNHDALIQGNVNPNQSFDDVAAESGRHFLTQPEYVDMHFPGGDGCGAGAVQDDFGHGYGLAGERLCDADPDNDGYYAFDVAGVRFLVLDTLNDDFAAANGFGPGAPSAQSVSGADIIGGYAEGAVDPAQLAWMRAEVAANPDKLLVIFSHHTVNSMFTSLAEGYCQEEVGCLGDLAAAAGYGTGEQLAGEMAAHPNFVGWIGGHTHRHRIEPKLNGTGGFWNIESSSLIDWPQQARAIELWVTADGAKGFWLLQGFTHDFQLSKDLEMTDPQRVPEAIGGPGDQDTLLWFDVPPGVQLTPQPLGTAAVQVAWLVEDPARGTAGAPLSIPFLVGPEPGRPLPKGLFAEAEVSHRGRSGALESDMARTPVALAPAEGGLAGTVTFTPEAAGTYEVTLHLLRPIPTGSQEVGSAQVQAVAAEGPEGPPNVKGTPPLPAGALLGLAVALALARRR